ncbi:ATP-dependent RecD-like DNA helicase [Candidatus Sumerlaeota bacterium]|nr:ATP-dependent RecD-like DNA helicase [Candidatus Sumerlaeota bacterium]
MFGGPEGEAAVSGVLERVTFYNPENHYTIARLDAEGHHGLITIVGNLVGATVGDCLDVRGRWKSHPQYGPQIEVESFRPVLPASAKGLEKYLGSGLIPGIGKKYAACIVAKFGVDVAAVLDNDPDLLGEVDGIGPKRLEQIKKAWGEQRSIRDLMVFLQHHDIPLTHASRIFRTYGEKAALILQKNPYQLAIDIAGIGFRTADAMAGRLGIPRDAPQRMEAGVLHLLKDRADDGHCFLPHEELLDGAMQLLEIDDPAPVNTALKRLHEEEKIHLEKLPDETKAVYLHYLWRFESAIARLIGGLLTTGKSLPELDVNAEIERFQREYNFQLAPEQRTAVEQALRGGVLIVTGGPGTGKTTLIRAIIEILRRAGASIRLCAPTGRAAKRLGEVTRMEAATIHRLLKFNPRTTAFEHNSNHPLKCHLLIVDESSMLDAPLAFHLLQALESGASLLLAGDVDQLPSVGPGNVLGDLIASGQVPVVRLETVFRQARASRIIVNAHRIHEGKMPFLDNEPGHGKLDFYFTDKSDPAEIKRAIIELVKTRIPRKFKFNARDDVQVITPMHRGELGTLAFNQELQAALNGKREPLIRGGRVFAVGDKVMQLRNNYDRDVYNGDIGNISLIDETEQTVWVDFYGRRVPYEYGELDELQLAYAITVHKSQGSEYPAVVIPIHTQHFVFLQRNLIYTAVTRGKKLVCLVGSKKALAMAVRNDQIQHRHTGLAQRLESLLGSNPA